MKRKGFRYRPSLPQLPVADHQPDLAGHARANGQGGLRSRRIFVIEQVRRLESTTHTKERSILILDDHPESLRLLLEHCSTPPRDLSAPEPVISRELILASILTIGALIAMLWPIL
jgi:hypothetical protein